MEPHFLGMGRLGCPAYLIDLPSVPSSVSSAKDIPSDGSPGRSTDRIRREQFAIPSPGLYLEGDKKEV